MNQFPRRRCYFPKENNIFIELKKNPIGMSIFPLGESFFLMELSFFNNISFSKIEYLTGQGIHTNSKSGYIF